MEQFIMEKPGLFQRVTRFYVGGFRRMTVGKTLWKLIFIKLLIMFGVLKLFFFPDFLETRFNNDQQRAEYVFSQLTLPVHSNNPTKEGGR